MKLRKFLAFSIMAAAAFSMTACDDDDDDDNSTDTSDEVVSDGTVSISLDQSTASIAVGETLSLTPTVSGADASNIVWASSDETIATVESGVVTGVAEGTAIVTATIDDASAKCLVTVTASSDSNTSESDAASLQGSDYYLFALDATSETYITDNVVADFRPDNENTFLYVWSETYEAGTASGKNFYGEAEEWTSLVVTSVGWSGFGICTYDMDKVNKLADVYNNASDYVFHIAIKSTDEAAHLFYLNGLSGAGYIAFGGDYTDGATTYSKYDDITRDGEWNEYEIPMSYLFDQGLIYSDDNSSISELNVLCGLSGGTAGVQLQYDAAFIYKPAAE